MKTFDRTSYDSLICPYCEHENYDDDCILINDGDTTTFNCISCGKDFTGQIIVVENYQTAKSSCESHTLKEAVFLENSKFYECTVCNDTFFSAKMPEKFVIAETKEEL